MATAGCEPNENMAAGCCWVVAAVDCCCSARIGGACVAGVGEGGFGARLAPNWNDGATVAAGAGVISGGFGKVPRLGGVDCWVCMAAMSGEVAIAVLVVGDAVAATLPGACKRLGVTETVVADVWAEVLPPGVDMSDRLPSPDPLGGIDDPEIPTWPDDPAIPTWLGETASMGVAFEVTTTVAVLRIAIAGCFACFSAGPLSELFSPSPKAVNMAASRRLSRSKSLCSSALPPCTMGGVRFGVAALLGNHFVTFALAPPSSPLHTE